MKAGTMQDNGGVTIPHETISALLAGASAVVGAGLLWLSQRVMGKAAFQEAINHGFKGLLEEVQREREIDRVEWSRKEAALRGEIANLNSFNKGLKRILRQYGVDIADDWRPPDDLEQPMLVLTRVVGPEARHD